MEPAALSDLLRAHVERGGVPAVAAALVTRDAPQYLGAFGKSDVARNLEATPDTIFRIASMTKPVTSLAAMMLCEEGQIALDDPVSQHLPEYRQPPVLTRFHAADDTYESRPASRPIAIRDLLTHTSGIAYRFFHPALRRLSASGIADADLPLLHDPGAKWTYGPGTAPLGQLVARVSGVPLDAFCRDRIFEPLGMADTGYSVPADRRDRVATLHQRDAAGMLIEQANPPAIASKGRGDDGLFSTARDYSRFLQLFLNGGRHGTTRLVSEETIRLMTTNQIGALTIERMSGDRSLFKEFPFGAGKDTFGFGFQIETPPSEPGRRAPGSYSWSGVFNTHFWVDPRHHIAAVMLMQLLPANDDAVTDLLRAFERLVYR